MGKYACVRDSIIMQDSVIEQGSSLFEVIADKRCRFGANCQIGVGDPQIPNKKFPDHLFTGLTVVGKEAHLPEKISIGRNSIVEPKIRPGGLASFEYPEGSTLS